MERIHRRIAAGKLIRLDAAVIVAGGTARRLGGIDKVVLPVAGRPLIEAVLTAVGDVPTVVVGIDRRTSRAVHHTMETPPGGGPAAGVDAGVSALAAICPQAEVVAVLAADLPGITPTTIQRLCAALDDPQTPGALLLDVNGHEQWLTGVWRVQALAAAIAHRPSWHGASVRSLLSIEGRVGVPGSTIEAADIDTPEDVSNWEQLRRIDGQSTDPADSNGQNGESGPTAAP